MAWRGQAETQSPAAVAGLRVYHIAGRKGRGRRQIDGGPQTQSRLLRIRHLDRADHGAGAAAVAGFRYPGLFLADRHPVIAQVAADSGNRAVSQHPDARMEHHRGHHGVDEA